MANNVPKLFRILIFFKDFEGCYEEQVSVRIKHLGK